MREENPPCTICGRPTECSGTDTSTWGQLWIGYYCEFCDEEVWVRSL